MNPKHVSYSSIKDRIRTPNPSVPLSIGNCLGYHKTKHEFTAELYAECVEGATDAILVCFSKDDVKDLIRNNYRLSNLYLWEGHDPVARNYAMRFKMAVNEVMRKYKITGSTKNRRHMDMLKGEYLETIRLLLKDGIHMTIALSVKLSAHGAKIEINSSISDGTNDLYLMDSVTEMPDDSQLIILLRTALQVTCSDTVLQPRIETLKNMKKES